MSDELLVKDFIKKAMIEIESGLGPNHALDGPVDFELSIGIMKSGKAGFNLKVLGVGGQTNAEHSDEIVHTIGFSVRSKDDLDHQIEQQFKGMLKSWLDDNGRKLVADLRNQEKQTPTIRAGVSDEEIRKTILRKMPDINPEEIPLLIEIIKEELGQNK